MSTSAIPIAPEDTAHSRDERVRRELEAHGLPLDAPDADLALSASETALTDQEKDTLLRALDAASVPETFRASVRRDLERA